MHHYEVVVMMIDIIHFYRSDSLDKVRAFYQDILGFTCYKDQGSCLIFDALGLGKIGFCTHRPRQKNESVCITLVYPSREEVDKVYAWLKTKVSISHQPSENKKFNIYHFFAQDFEGNAVEFQTFLD